ncbi:cation transporter [Zoogloea sp.]|uniref:cation transporter n=1 Tax=Zoogloea sp. TaxID=49181 RepID=UPI0035ADC841
MSACGCSGGCSSAPAPIDPRFRRALGVALIINALMCGVEIVGGLAANSVSLLADAVDFAGDAANYALSLAVLSLGALWRTRAAGIKALSMGAYGVFVLGKAGWAALHGSLPEPYTMGGVALLALLANLSVAVMLYAFRSGDANMRSVWLCSRNDAIVNVIIGIAALGVFQSGSRWPDLVVAGAIAGLALSGAFSILRQVRSELEAQGRSSLLG